MKTPEEVPAALPEDIRSEEALLQVLEEGDPQKLARVAAFFNQSLETVNLMSRFAKLRTEAIHVLQKDTTARMLENKTPTAEELSAGLYREQLEPHVREAVFQLRRKGYQTFSSGFEGFLSQHIAFKNSADLGPFSFSEEFLKQLNDVGGEIEIREGNISIAFKKFVDLETLCELWKRVAKELPVIGPAAGDSDLPGSKKFRRDHSV